MYFRSYYFYQNYCAPLTPGARLPCGFTETLLAVTAPFWKGTAAPCSAALQPVAAVSRARRSGLPPTAAALFAPLHTKSLSLAGTRNRQNARRECTPACNVAAGSIARLVAGISNGVSGSYKRMASRQTERHLPCALKCRGGFQYVSATRNPWKAKTNAYTPLPHRRSESRAPHRIHRPRGFAL